MHSLASPAATASPSARATVSTEIDPLDRDRFEHLTEAEAVSLLASRFRCFIESGWAWNDALLLAVRPDPRTEGLVPRPGDATRMGETDDGGRGCSKEGEGWPRSTSSSPTTTD